MLDIERPAGVIVQSSSPYRITLSATSSKSKAEALADLRTALHRFETELRREELR